MMEVEQKPWGSHSGRSHDDGDRHQFDWAGIRGALTAPRGSVAKRKLDTQLKIGQVFVGAWWSVCEVDEDNSIGPWETSL